MSCDQLQDHYELYAMGVADEPEGSEIRAHLNRGCEVCVTELKRAQALTAALSGLAEPAAPSPNLRRRILASVGAEQRHFAWMPVLAAATALSLFAAVYFAGRERGFAEEANQLRARMRDQAVELARLNEAFAILNGPETKMVTFGAGQTQPPKGKFFVNPSLGVLLMASNLPPAPAGKVYEMWLVPKSGNPARAGEFRSESNGTAMHIRPGAVDPSTISAVAVTMENEGGADRPTPPILFAAPLQ